MSEHGDFFRQLQYLTTRVHAARNVDEIMLDLSEAACALFAADRLTIYAVGDDRTSLVSKVKTGLSSFRQLRLPISAHSVAGYAALARKLVNLADVYDASELQRHAPELRFQQGVDRRTGYRTREMLVVPLLHDGEVGGVFQLINNLAGGPFDATVVDGARYLCDALAVALAQRRETPRRERDGFVGALRQGPARANIEEALRQARASGRDIEDVLVDDFQLKLPVVGRALADHYAVPYLGYHAQRRIPAALLDRIDRTLAEREGWLPVEQSGAGPLYVVCTDPEGVRATPSLGERFPDVRPVFCVTTRREFGAMLDQYLGAAKRAEDREAQLAAALAALMEGAHGRDLSNLRIDTAPGERPGEIRFTVSGVLRPAATS